MSRYRRGFLLAFVALAITASAFAQRSTRRLGVNWQDGVPRVSFSARDLIDSRVRRDLASGVRKRLVLTVQAFREGGGAPIATREVVCSVHWDVWQERYFVARGRAAERPVPSLAGVLRRCLVVHQLPVGRPEHYARHQGRRVYFAVRAEFNPISRRDCRSLLRSSGGATNPSGTLTINIVRRQICQADRAIEFQSPAAVMP